MHLTPSDGAHFQRRRGLRGLCRVKPYQVCMVHQWTPLMVITGRTRRPCGEQRPTIRLSSACMHVRLTRPIVTSGAGIHNSALLVLKLLIKLLTIRRILVVAALYYETELSLESIITHAATWMRKKAL